MPANRITHLRTLLVSTLLAADVLAGAGAAQAADRADPIPANVGPPGRAGFYINPSAVGLDAARVQAIVQRSIARWGDAYLGLTTAVPGVADGISVVGVTTLPTGLLGLATTRSSTATVPAPATQNCVPAPRELSDTARRQNRRLTARLRRDTLVGRSVRRRTIRRRITVPKFTVVRAPAIAQLCTLGAATSNQRPVHEFDVQLRVSPDSAPWTLGPALPTSAQYDFESNVLHELGHISGLAHQIDPCDPSTPMPSGQKNGEFWHAVDQWRRPGCPVTDPPAPIPTPIPGSDSVQPLPGAGATALAGRSILINPRVPPGYDSARFVALASRAIRRAGGVVAGATGAPTISGDGESVLGFASLRVNALTNSQTVPRQQTLQAYTVTTCRKARVKVRRQVVSRRTVRKRGRRLRRDLIRTRTRTIAGYKCSGAPRPAVTAAIAPEIDLRINEVSVAWELGPKFPVDGTRWDLETALLQNIMSSAGVAAGTACDTTTPNTPAGASPGDWWRSTAEVRRTRCLTGEENTQVATRRVRTAGGKSTTHYASGLPEDVRAMP